MFTVELEGVDELEREWNEGVRDLGAGIRRASILAAKEGVDEGKRTGTWTDRTGEARRTLTSRLVKDTFGEVEADILGPLPRHVWLDSGTKPHEILPKTLTTGGRGGRFRYAMLRFVSEGRVVFARRVWHPGTKGDGYAGRMYFKAERVLRAELEKAAQKFADRFG